MIDNNLPEPKQLDNPLIWLVPSNSNHNVTYQVDLGANNGIGECSCRGFQITCLQQMKRREVKVARCTHLREIRNLLRNKLFEGKDPLDFIIEMMVKKDKNYT